MCTSHSVFNTVSPLALNSLMLSFLLLNKTAWFILDIPQTFIEKKWNSKFWLYPGDPIPTDEF